MTASRTTPTLCVFVIITGPSRKPDSSTQVVPVISPLPFSDHQPAKTELVIESFPRGRTAVTPVRTGPLPTCNFPSPEMSVVCPTVTPETSVIALSGPAVPSKGTPRSRARGFAGGLLCAETNDAIANEQERMARYRKDKGRIIYCFFSQEDRAERKSSVFLFNAFSSSAACWPANFQSCFSTASVRPGNSRCAYV